MVKLCANLTLLPTELEFLKRFKAAKRAGFTAVECRFPYEHHSIALAEELDKQGLSQVGFNLPAGNWGDGAAALRRIPVVVVSSRMGSAWRSNMQRIFPAPVDRAGQCSRHAGLLAGPPRGCRSPDRRDGGRKYLHPIRSVSSAKVCRRTVGDIQQTQGAHCPYPRSDNPGRHEPGTGEINVSFLFDFLDREGYGGWIGCDCKPARATMESLGWAASYLAAGAFKRKKHDDRVH